MRELRIEALEGRDLLAFSGFAILNPEHVTYSEVNGPYMNSDAVEVESTYSDHVAGCEDPDRQIARALQQWADVSVFNFNKVPDAGLPVPDRFLVPDAGNHGTIALAHYANQGSNDPPYLAQGIPPLGVFGKASDVNFRGNVCNSPDKLFYVARHEFGHALGFLHDVGVMSGSLSVTSSFDVLDPNTVADVQAVYGVRQPDAFDAVAANDSWATPSFLFGDASAALTTPADVDNYVVQAQGSTLTVEIDPTSLLSPFLLAYAGQPWPAAADSGDYAETASVTFPTTPGHYYGIQVLSNDADFQVGAYDIRLEHGGGGHVPHATHGMAAAARALAIDYALERR